MTRKTALVVIGEDIILRNIFSTDFHPEFSRLVQLSEFRIVYVMPEEIRSRARSVLGDGAEIVVMGHVPQSRFDMLLTALMRNSIDTHTNHWERMRAYADARAGFLSTTLKRVWAFLFSRWAFPKIILRRIFVSQSPHACVESMFDAVCPDVVMPLCLVRFDYDVPIAREARRRGIPIVGMVRSWDNLTSHGLLNVVPDKFLLQNAFLARAARCYQGIDPDVCKTVGVAHYDAYHATPDVISREELCARLDLDPHKRIILYGAMGEFLFAHERDMLDIFDEMCTRNAEFSDIQVLFRAHPSFIPTGATVQARRNIRMALPAGFSGKDNDISSERLLISSIYHSDLVVTCGSTFGIDAFVLDKPLICVAFDGRHRETYWRSAERFYDHYTHYERFVDLGEVPVVRSEQELVVAMKSGLRRKAADPKARKRILEEFVGVFDGHAGTRLAARMHDALVNLTSA